jgi:hypothetical protein
LEEKGGVGLVAVVVVVVGVGGVVEVVYFRLAALGALFVAGSAAETLPSPLLVMLLQGVRNRLQLPQERCKAAGVFRKDR